MLQVSVNRRQLAIFTAVIALFVSVAWVSVGSRASAASATPVVYVATGENFPDALGASAAAAVQGGPVLLVTKNSIPPETATELSRLSPDAIFVAGGTAVVSDTVFEALKTYAPSVIRVAGSNRYATAAEVSKSAFPVTLAGGGDTAALEAAVAALTARLDAFEASGKAADSDLLDGKDSTAFVGHGEIVMTTSGNSWLGHGRFYENSIEPNERRATETVFLVPTRAVISLTGPGSIDGVEYGLASFDLCVITTSNYVSEVSVTGIESFGSDVNNDQYLNLLHSTFPSPGLTTGCHTFVVNKPVGQGAGLYVEITDIADGSPVTLASVRSVWTPEAAQPSQS